MNAKSTWAVSGSEAGFGEGFLEKDLEAGLGGEPRGGWERTRVLERGGAGRVVIQEAGCGFRG